MTNRLGEVEIVFICIMCLLSLPFLAFLACYLRFAINNARARRRREARGEASNPMFPQSVDLPEPAQSASSKRRKRGLRKSDWPLLCPETVHDRPSASGNLEYTCAVCLDFVQQGDKKRTLPCSHGYHSSCIEIWLVKSAKCPLCNLDLRLAKEEIRNKKRSHSRGSRAESWSLRAGDGTEQIDSHVAEPMLTLVIANSLTPQNLVDSMPPETTFVQTLAPSDNLGEENHLHSVTIVPAESRTIAVEVN